MADNKFLGISNDLIASPIFSELLANDELLDAVLTDSNCREMGLQLDHSGDDNSESKTLAVQVP